MQTRRTRCTFTWVGIILDTATSTTSCSTRVNNLNPATITMWSPRANITQMNPRSVSYIGNKLLLPLICNLWHVDSLRTMGFTTDPSWYGMNRIWYYLFSQVAVIWIMFRTCHLYLKQLVSTDLCWWVYCSMNCVSHFAKLWWDTLPEGLYLHPNTLQKQFETVITIINTYSPTSRIGSPIFHQWQSYVQ